MDKEKYWKVFLETGKTYEGWLWKSDLDIEKWFKKEDDRQLGNIPTVDGGLQVIYEEGCDQLENFANVSVIVLSAEDSFVDTDESKLVVEINDTIHQQNLYWYEFYYAILAEKERNQLQLGNIQLQIPKIEEPHGKVLKIMYYDFQTGKELKDVSLEFYSLPE